MNKQEVLDAYLSRNKVPDAVIKRININSFLTPNFSYGALRIGNSIGDVMNISSEILLLEEIAAKHKLEVNTTEHVELHSRGVAEKDLDALVRGALQFEGIINDKKIYKQAQEEISAFVRKKMKALIK